MATRNHGTIAITGSRSVLGRLLMERLATTDASLAVIDIERPPQKCRYYPLNLVEPNTDLELERIFREIRCKTVIHLAYLSRPVFDVAYSHELQSIGTLNMLHAARGAGVKHILTVSPSGVYGARGKNPNFLTEEHQVKPNKDFEYIRDRAEADQDVVAFMKKHPDIAVTLLRMAPMVGPLSDNLTTRMLAAPAVVTLLGYDPLLQFLHEDDAVDALLRALEYRRSGIFNIAPDGVVPVTTALYRAGVVGIPVAHPVAYSTFHTLWVTRLNDIPPQQLDFLRYQCSLDNSRAKGELTFRPRFTSQGALLEHLGKKRRAA